MYRQDPGEYISRLLRQSDNGSVGEIFETIPLEIGRCRVEEKKTRMGVSCLDWEMRWEQDMKVEKNYHAVSDFIQFIFFLNSSLDWEIGDSGKSVSMEKGEACIYWDRSQPTTGYYEKYREFEFKSLQIPVPYFFSMMEGVFSLNERKTVDHMLQSVTKIKITSYIYRLLKEIEDTGRYLGGVGTLYLESKVLELFAACLEAGLESGSRALCKRLAISRTDQEAILSVKNKIDLDSANVPGCDQLAREINLSLSKLTKGFKELTGMPLHTYVIDKRLEYAACLLTQNRMNVSQAAMCSGYSNMSHFSAAFRKKFGVRPKDYRR